MVVRLTSISVVLASVLSGAAAAAQTVAPNQVFGRYQQFHWQEQHGLPQNTVLAVTATRDGYLWLGTYEGAVRFDGTRFAAFNPGNTPEIGNQHVTALLEDSAGAL
jgi:ligand-binding sensor domain-containing protein